MNIQVSVVIPNFNREDLIIDALTSVLNQTYRPIQLIVVDDGSKDQSVKNVQLWAVDKESADFEIKIIEQENLGGNPARNRGIREATGLFIAFLDSDDLWHPTKLEKQMERISKNDNIGAVYCGLQEIELETGNIINKEDRKYLEGWILSEMLVRDETAPTSTYLLKKEVFEKVGFFDESLQARQDWDMWIRVASKYMITAVPEILVDYRHHKGPRTASNPNKEINAYATILEKYKALISDQVPLVQRNIKSSYFRRMGRVHFHSKISTRKAIQYYLLAIKCSPFYFDNWAALIGVFIPANLRKNMHKSWNKLLGKTSFAIKSH